MGDFDRFFDSADHLCSEEPGVSDPCSSSMYYDVWMNKLLSVEERKKNFFLEMGFAESCEISASGFVEDRLFDGVVCCNSRTDSVEEVREVDSNSNSNGDANVMIDEEHQEKDKSKSSVSGDGSLQIKENKAKVKRWWSFLKRKNIGADDTLKVKNNKKQWMEFSGFHAAQEIQAHTGVIWSMKFSPDGQFLASGGADGIVRVWKVKSADANFDVMEVKSMKNKKKKNLVTDPVVVPNKIFWIDESPLHQFHGHTGDILDLDWSTSNYLLSASSDGTVRLWRLGSENCIGVFRHNDFVTCIQFNPVDENYFLSGSIDGKVRIWGVSEGRVVDWGDVHDIITAICYQPDGKGFVVGSIMGTCHFFKASDVHLQPDAVIQIQGRKKTSNRITSIQFSRENPRRMMITSEDGKIRILEGLEIVHKYRGVSRCRSQLSGSFTTSGAHIVSVGDDSRVYLWNYDASSTSPFKPTKSDRSCEHFFSEAVSVALPWSSSNGTEQDSLTSIQRTESVRDSDRFSLGNWFSMEGGRCMGASATWPEEKLPLWEEEQGGGGDFDSDRHGEFGETWGMVVVTASLDGKIKAYHNYGLPVRL